MKSILCFGDSLTWGFMAGTWTRHAFADRWPNVLAAGLEGRARVIEEGMNGRTTAYDDTTDAAELNGAVGLPIMLKSHEPLDLVIIMLGTNDLKFAARCRAFDAALGMGRLIEIVQQYPYNDNYAPPKLLIMSPPAMVRTDDEWFDELWGHAIEESKKLAYHYERLARERGVHFFDAGSVASADPIDGGHLDAANTRAIGEALVPLVRRMLDHGSDPAVTIRAARASDGLHIAALADIAGRGLPAQVWAGMRKDGQSIIEVGRGRAMRGTGGFSHKNVHIAELGGEIAGMLLGYRQADPYDAGNIADIPALFRPLVELEAKAPGSWYVNMLALFEEHRGRGIGRSLLAHGEKLARQSGANSMSIIVEAANDTALRLYRRAGFAEHARLPVALHEGSTEPADWVLLVKQITD